MIQAETNRRLCSLWIDPLPLSAQADHELRDAIHGTLIQVFVPAKNSRYPPLLLQWR
jgi:hypothetical protein